MIITFFAILPLIIILLFTIKRIRDKTSLINEIIYHTFFQSLISYLFLMLLFFQGFIYRFYFSLILLFLFLFISLFYFLKDTDLSFTVDGVIKLEGIKNNVITVLITVLPFYVVLTIFRYQPWYLQLIISSFILVVLFIITSLISKKMENFWENAKTWFEDSGPIKYVYIWLIIGVFLFFSFFFQIPTNSLKQGLNLNNNAKYWVFDGLPTDIQNNYEQVLVADLKLAEQINRSYVKDFYIFEDTLYITYENIIEVYSITQEKQINRLVLDYAEDMYSEDSPFNRNFTFYNNNLYYFGYEGLYIVKEEETKKISDLSANNSEIFYDSQETMYLLNRESNGIYHIYKIENENVNKIDSIYINVTDYEGIKIISDTLFYIKNDKYIFYEDDSLSFAKLDGQAIYDSNKSLMYYIFNNGFYVNNGNISQEILEMTNKEFPEGAMIGDTLIFSEKNELEKSNLLIFDEEEFVLFNHLDTDTFIINNDYQINYVSNYREFNGEITFLQIESKTDKTLLQVFRLNKMQVDLKFPFYTHYGIAIIFWVFVGLVIPTTDDIKYITYIDFASVTDRKDD